MKPYILAETNWKNVKDEHYEIAILPWGATEAHNYHLPYATDNIEAHGVAKETCRKAWEQGAKVLLLPTIPFGVNTGQMDIPFCMNLNPCTQYAILKDVAQVLHRSGINKLVIFNSHGGNHFKQMIRELSIEFPAIFTCTLNWFHALDAKAYFDDPGDHAGELETSVVMHLAPDLVLPLEEAGDGSAKNYKIKGLREGWVSSQRQWTAVTKDTGVGNPKNATAKKGQKFIEAVTKKIADFLVELHHADVNKLYE